HNSPQVPRKNMRDFYGRPLFHWVIDALTESKYAKENNNNTDSEEIAKSATDNFDVTIHMRPDYLLTITGNEANQIMAHDLSLSSGDYFLQTHSTNPLLRAATIDKAVETFFQSPESDSLFTVTPMQKRFYWEDGRPVNHDPHNMIKTQELPFIYEENSCIYIFSRQVFEQYKDRIGRKPKMLPMEPLESVDIDDKNDFALAENLMKERLKNG
ncbi:MAG: acylneuraminate cytidylyltransferase family protein, partial [bacterium]|nr:acylneuraminate cytidylyltransferase family protein [bacterium]